MDNTQLIKDVLNDFDFERVHKTMIALGWGWGENNEVPTITQLRANASHLLNSMNDIIMNKNIDMVGTGGFEAFRYGDYGLGLRFVVEEMNDDLVNGQ